MVSINQKLARWRCRHESLTLDCTLVFVQRLWKRMAWRMMGEMERVDDYAENGPACHFLYSRPLNGPSEICCPVPHLESHRSYIAVPHQNQAQISKDRRSILERTYLANRLAPPENKCFVVTIFSLLIRSSKAAPQ